MNNSSKYLYKNVYHKYDKKYTTQNPSNWPKNNKS